jgi:hypothetical protein
MNINGRFFVDSKYHVINFSTIYGNYFLTLFLRFSDS